MPKPTFLNLPEAKQKRLLAAAKSEFSKAGFDDVSVASIIAAAGIPRGSFYQYFEDKSDLYEYLLTELRNASFEDWYQELKRQDGDLFVAFRNYFGSLLEDAVAGANADFYKNVFLHMDYTRSQRMSERFRKRSVPKYPQLFNDESIQTDLLRLDSPEDYQLVLHILIGIFYQIVAHYYLRQQQGQRPTLAQTQRNFYQIIDWFQFGIQRTKGDGQHVATR